MQRLVDSLRPGQTGCLQGGRYRENVTIQRGGANRRPIVLTAAPGRRATLLGALWIARRADFVTIANMTLNGEGAGVPSPQVNASHVTFYNDDITNDHTGICLVLGGAGASYGFAFHTTIVRNRIHDCGKLPPTHYDHGVYLGHSRYTTIVDNYIYDNADWGLHLYPDARSSTIQYNVIDGNGSGLLVGGSGDLSSSDNYIAHNIFSNATDASAAGVTGNNYGYDVTSFWGGAVGRNNVVTHNCFWNATSGDVNDVNGGFSAEDNVVADPRYVDRSQKDFRLRPGSPCAGAGPRRS